MANVINMVGGGANIQSKTVKSSDVKQTITPPDGVDGFSPVIVEAVVPGAKEVYLDSVTPVNDSKIVIQGTAIRRVSAVFIQSVSEAAGCVSTISESYYFDGSVAAASFVAANSTGDSWIAFKNSNVAKAYLEASVVNGTIELSRYYGDVSSRFAIAPHRVLVVGY